MLSVNAPNVMMLIASFFIYYKCCFSYCHNSEWHYAECCYTDCNYAECHYAQRGIFLFFNQSVIILSVLMLNAFLQIVIMLSVNMFNVVASKKVEKGFLFHLKLFKPDKHLNRHTPAAISISITTVIYCLSKINCMRCRM